MVLTGYKYNNVAIRAPGGGLAGNLACCCVDPPNTECCCLAQYFAAGEVPDAELTVTFTGTITGTGTIQRVDDIEGYCGRWLGTITMDDGFDCGGDLVSLDVEVRCPTGATSPDALEIIVSGGGAACEVSPPGGGAGDPVNPDAGGTCSPLSVVATDGWVITEILAGECDCEDGIFTVTITGP